MLDKVDVGAAAAALGSSWSPETIAAYNGDHVQVLRMEGEWVWHQHDRTDDLFYVVRGAITIQMRARDVRLEAGELFVVPRGVEHCVRAEPAADVLVIEHLGDVDAVGADAYMEAPPLAR